MTTNWLTERFEKALDDVTTKEGSWRIAIWRHFSDLDPTAKDAEIAELRAEVERLKKAKEQLYKDYLEQSNALYVQVKELASARAEINRLQSELASKPAWPVLRYGGSPLEIGHLIYQGLHSTFIGDGSKSHYDFFDFGPVPAFPPVEEKPPEWKRVRHKNNGTIHYAWETTGESSKPGFRYWRDSKDRVIPGEYVEVLP